MALDMENPVHETRGDGYVAWSYKSCKALVAEGVDDESPWKGTKWATLYLIQSSEPNKGHATGLVKAMKKYYNDLDIRFAGTVAMNPAMRKVYIKTLVHEYCGDDVKDHAFHKAFAEHLERPPSVPSAGGNEHVWMDDEDYVGAPATALRNDPLHSVADSAPKLAEFGTIPFGNVPDKKIVGGGGVSESKKPDESLN